MASIKSGKESLKERLGSDAKFPIQGNFETTSGVDLLLQDIEQLLLTLPGERVNRPSFGCTLRNQIWENIEEAALQGKASIKAAIIRFEPRVQLLDVDYTINQNTNLITFNIRFIVKANNTPLNLVFPFRSGTQLSFS